MSIKRKPIALFLAVILMMSVLGLAVAAEPGASAGMEVVMLDEYTLQIIGLPEYLTNPLADLYTEERIGSKKIITYYAEDAVILDGVMECNAEEMLQYDTEYILIVYNDDNDDEIRFRFTLTEETEEPTEPEEPVDPTVPEDLIPQFSDVTYPNWYSGFLEDCVQRGLVSGVGGNRFAPDQKVTRAQVAQILYALEGKPELIGDSEIFTDIPDGKWYSNAVNWAAHNKIMSGYVTGQFQPDAAITRQQFMATLYKYTRFKSYDATRSGNVETYDDYDQITEYAVPAIQWAVGHGVMTGNEKNKLMPKDTTTRCQMVAVLSSYMKNIVEQEA